MTNLLVTPEKLVETSNNFQGIFQNASNTIATMMDTVRNLSAKWEGEASTAFLNQFNKLDGDMTKLKRMIQEHVEDLLKIADVYKKAEAANAQMSSKLPFDAIH